MAEQGGIIYNASTNEKTIESVVNEATDTIIDPAVELATANSKIAELESLILAQNDEIVALKTKLDSLSTSVQSSEEMKILIIDIKTIDPQFDTKFLLTMTLDQLKLIKETFTRIIK